MDEKVIERFKYFMSDETPVFNSYVLRKANGEKLDFELLSPEDLQEMFIEEDIIDSVIADLFDVKKDVVRKKRYKHGIKLGQTFSRKRMQKLEEYLEEYIESSFQVTEKSQSIERVFIPIKILFNLEDDLIFVPYRVFENDGRPYPFYDYEDLQEIDTEAFCVRISKVKREVGNMLGEIVDFLLEYEWDDEIYFERNDEKVIVTASLYTEEDSRIDKISLTVSLQISGQHPLGDIIFDSEYDLHNGTLKFCTDNSDFELDEDEIQEIFMDCWDGVRRYVQVQKEIESELEDET